MTTPILEQGKDYITSGGQYIWIKDVQQLLEHLIPDGDWANPERERTAARFAKMIVELTTENPFEFTTFESTVDELVIVKDIPFVSLCAHHVVPFVGVAHIGYVPDGLVGGLSKFARLVQNRARGLWNQENLTADIGQELLNELGPLGVAVVLNAEHLCMTIRGVQTPGTRTTTSFMSGCFRDTTKQARNEFMQLLGLP